MFNKIIRILGGDPLKREVERLSQIVEEINSLEAAFENLSDEELSAKTPEFKQRLADGETLDDLLAEAFAAVREASKRTIGLRHYDVQLIGGMVLHQGKIAEMRTGEGKTLVATLPLYLNALTGRGAHLVTVNDYLARRDARWMAPIYNLLGLSVGVLQMASRTENGKKAFIVDLEKSSPFEDQHQLRLVDRVEAYKTDITYGMNSEYGFDFLRDNLTYRLADRVQRGHNFAIVDEVDNILIDEARTPLIISGPAADDAEWYNRMAQVVRGLKPEDYEISEKDRTVSLTEAGVAHVEELLDMTLRDPDRPEDITPEQARVMGFLEQGLRAQFLFRRNKDYLVQAGKVVIVDEFTGRLMPGRRWSEGLHQAVEAKEGVKVEPENVTYATITIQNYFRMYDKLSGMTGTGLTEAEEFSKIYKLDVQPIPTNLEYAAMRANAELAEVEGKEEGYKVTYYARKGDPDKTPVFWRRKDYPDVVYRTEEAKLRAIIEEITRFYLLGRPQLIGTTSVEHSERLSDRLKAEPIRRLLQVLLVRRAWMEKNKTDFIEQRIPELEFLNKPLDDINPGELRQAGKPLGLASINPEDPANLDVVIRALGVTPNEKERLIKTIQGGVPHQVLNARKHDEESQIIARAGSFGMVTIATNMAGRGVDIKLGGDLPEDVLAGVIRVLQRTEHDPYDMTNEQRLVALQAIPLEEYGIHAEAINAFLGYMNDMQRVRALGGLHVIGSERHEARRIDNQLRGRAARQGDPGSSRFYLSLEDELMRLFGGQQVDSLIKRLNIDENYPIEHNLLGRLVEQAQERVEGSNFDVRKHLLEYDDVLNTQRQRIYAQRDRVFTKPDLTEDVIEMLETDLNLRVPEALKDEEEGPWKLLAFMDEVQPTLDYEGVLYPSLTLRLLVDELKKQLEKTPGTVYDMREACLNVAVQALQVEHEHILKAARTLLDRMSEALERQRDERIEVLDNYIESLQGKDEEDEQALQRRPQEIAEELGQLLHTPLRLTPEQLRQLAGGQEEVKDVIREQVETNLLNLAVVRSVTALERRVENLGFKPGQLQNLSWQEISDGLLQSVASGLEAQAERLVGENGQIARDLEPWIEKLKDVPIVERNLMAMLTFMAQGTRVAFDKRTHRQSTLRFTRLNYVYLAARQLEGRPARDITDQVLDHARGAIGALTLIWGIAEWKRLNQNEVTLNQLDTRHQDYLAEHTGAEKMNEIADQPLAEMSQEDRNQLVGALGKRLLNESFRELLLSVISQAWVEYLTRVEALRVSIGLEAYAQRDPLVMYKGKASELFQELLKEIRSGVVNRMFTFRPSRAASVVIDRERSEAPAELAGVEESQPAEVGPSAPQEQSVSAKKKRRHH